MQKKILGNTGLLVSCISLGGMATDKMDLKSADKVYNTALDNGINFIDTSPEYKNSEEYIGKTISHRRDEYFLATKCGDHHQDFRRWTRKNLMDNLDTSLKELQTEYIDLWQMHGLMPEYLKNGEHDETLEYMKEAQKAGKVRLIGATLRNGNPGDELYPAGYSYKALSTFIKWDVFQTFQLVYGCLTRKNEKAITAAANRGKGIFVRGNFREYFNNYPQLFDEAKLSELFEEGDDKISFMLRFVLSHTGVSSVVIGTSNPENVLKNIKTAEKGSLRSEVYTEAKKRLDEVCVISEEFPVD